MNTAEATAVLAAMRRDAPAMSPTFRGAWEALMREVEELADSKRPGDAKYDAHILESVNSLSHFIGKPDIDAVPEPVYAVPESGYGVPEPDYMAPEQVYELPDPVYADQAGGATAGTYVAQALLAAVVFAGSVLSSIT